MFHEGEGFPHSYSSGLSKNELDQLGRQLGSCASRAWESTVWRMHASRYVADDPGGSYRVSGRYHRGRDHFDEDEVFPALYLATVPEVSLGEKQRHLTSGTLPQMRNQVLSELHVCLQEVRDLSGPEEIGICRAALMDDYDYSFSQSVSAVLRSRGAEALLVPSATLLGENLVVFPDRLLEGSSLQVLANRPTRLYVEPQSEDSS